MTDPTGPPEPDPRGVERREGAFARVTRARRGVDFLALILAAVAILAGAAAVGEISLLAAGACALLIAAFAMAYFAGTADIDRDALRAAGQAASEEEQSRQRQTEKAFRAAVVEALSEPALFVDAAGKVEVANSAARRQFHVAGVEPLLTAVVRRPELLDAVAEARAGHTQVFEFVERDETDRYFSCVAAPLVTPLSSGVLVSMRDLTEIRRAELARVDFLANASHELKTPLTSLSGFIETLRGPARDDPAAWDRFLEIMHGQAERMRRLINDLLSLSRIELIEHRPPDTKADLAAVVAEAADALMPVAAERQVKLRISGAASGVLVIGVRDELAQVAQNLIDNAIKYSDPGDVVEIEVLSGLTRDQASNRAGRRWPEAGHMSIATASSADTGLYAALRVSDAGPGIDRQHLPRLAERFYRVDPGRGLRPGTGLGLAIVKHVITRHRGEFLVESETGKGSAFGVVLPAAPGDVATQPAATISKRPPGAVSG